MSGRRAASIAALAAVTILGGCYGFRGGGGFPSDIRTLYVSTFENQTPQFDLGQQIFRKIQERVPRALGVRPGGREVADALIEGRIVRYEDQAMTNPLSGGQVNAAQGNTHQVQVVVSVRIVDLKRNQVIWENSGVNGQGEWRTDNQTVDVGREIAIDQIVQKIIDGAQSQW